MARSRGLWLRRRFHPTSHISHPTSRICGTGLRTLRSPDVRGSRARRQPGEQLKTNINFAGLMGINGSRGFIYHCRTDAGLSRTELSPTCLFPKSVKIITPPRGVLGHLQMEPLSKNGCFKKKCFIAQLLNYRWASSRFPRERKRNQVSLSVRQTDVTELSGGELGDWKSLMLQYRDWVSLWDIWGMKQGEYTK